jgi:dihydropteroate synthase
MTEIRIMGVLNVTPDSFSDGGRFASLQAAIEQADRLVAAGADIVDVGGESTRPYAEPVSAAEESARVIPVIEAIRRRHRVPISIDTSKAAVARAALAAGADMINDISALRQDPEMVAVVRQCSVPVVLMHMQGTPADMQIRPSYRDVVAEILDFFEERVTWLAGQGIDRNRLIVDPGIGFGKSLQHNLSLLKHLDAFSRLGLPLLLGHSRKRFLGEITGQATAGERDLATAVVAALCCAKGVVKIVRVHDVAGTRQALQLAAALAAAD